jgi:D-alanine-D-alanine ligase
VVENMRGEELYTLPSVEILPPSGDFYSYDAKYSGTSRHVCPGNFSRTVSEELQRQAKVIHRALGLRHYSRSDFIVTPKGIYYLETNTLPGLTTESNVPIELSTVGITLSAFFSHLINLALER